MICPKRDCPMSVAGAKTKLRTCSICGTPLLPDTKDVLQDNIYNLIDAPRSEQVRLATTIENIFHTPSGTLLAEGGTGLGKSYAYSIPALLKIHRHTFLSGNQRAVITTAKNTLQASLRYDLPKICKLLNLPLNVQFLMGRQHYACFRLEGAVPDRDLPAYMQFVQLARTEKRPACRTDWKGMLPFWWADVNIDNCVLGTECPDYRYCHPHPQNGHILVTNHTLTGLDLSIGVGTLLGAYNHLIVDEAHQFPATIRSAFTKTEPVKLLDKSRERLVLDRVLREVIMEVGGDYHKITELATNLNQATSLLMHIYTKARACASNNVYNPRDLMNDCSDLFEQLAKTTVYPVDLETSIYRMYALAKGNSNGADLNTDYGNPGLYLAAIAKLRRLLQKPFNRIQKLSAALQEGTTEIASNYLYQATRTDKHPDGELSITPIQIDKILGPILKQVPYKVFVSATLANGRDFTAFTSELGITATVSEIYKSPFARTNACIYMPDTVPLPEYADSPARDTWLNSVADEIVKICTLTRGGAFVLFSASRDQDQIEAITRPQLQQLGIPLFVQHSGDNTDNLLAQFKASNGNVLYGLKSIWEGVDVAGDTLRCVIIPKLPFPNPNDPLFAKRCALIEQRYLEEHANEYGVANDAKWAHFRELDVPLMIADVRQGAGRLLRKTTDKGIIAILDPRIWTGAGAQHPRRLNQCRAEQRRTGKELRIYRAPPPTVFPGQPPPAAKHDYHVLLLNALDFAYTNNFTSISKWFNNRFSTLTITATVNDTVPKGEEEDGTSAGYQSYSLSDQEM